MKWLYYIKYFFHIAWNWNARLAWFTVFHEIRGEKKYGINTIRLNNLTQLTLKGDNLLQAEIYQGAGYYLLENIFTELKRLKASGGFVDLGCGKGRALAVAAHFGFTEITGIDFARELCDEAIRNCRQIAFRYPSVAWQVIHGDAAYFSFTKNMQVIFFFNPFKEAVMEKVIQHILKSKGRYRRKIWIAYINPQYKALFLQYGFRESYTIRKMAFAEASIFEKDP